MNAIAFATACVVYRASNSPPSVPDVRVASCRLTPRGASSPTTTAEYTHVLIVPTTTDIRDDFTAGATTFGPNADKVFVPDELSPVTYRVLLVRRMGRSTSQDFKECLLVRTAVTWPTDDL
ncbi:MAG: hypothetical protein EBV06_04730 [Planctomycetia bacterium]|nr:hypothetical protein [Planctomycetia bacterium]